MAETAFKTHSETVELIRVTIGLNDNGCGHSFYMTRDHYDVTMNEKRGWFCPICGKPRAWLGETKVAKLERELAAEKKRTEWAQQEARNSRERADKAERSKVRLQKRVKNGVCPCCHRTVSQLARHMKTKHPEFASNGEAPRE